MERPLLGVCILFITASTADFDICLIVVLCLVEQVLIVLHSLLDLTNGFVHLRCANFLDLAFEQTGDLLGR
jgi:hypothetical protein